MSMEETSLTESHLKFYFIIKDGLNDIEQVSNDMRVAFSNIREYIEEEDNVKWLQTEECLELPKKDLTKKDIFVLEEFAGRTFEYLQTTKALIIGPRSVLSCLMDNLSIPLGKSPIFTTAMRGLVISASAFSITEKTKIAKYIGWMGGYYRDDLSAICTHLVTATVKSAKYEKAAINNIPIMQSDWIYNVWECSQKENISATSSEFDKYKLPIFYKLNMTTTGISIEKKNELVKLIKEHGGQYVGTFKSAQTDILLLEKDGVDSQKYQAAIKFKKDCLLPDWVLDSVSKGYALPTTNYKVSKMKVSTPTKMEESISISDFNPDCTEISVISHADNQRNSCTINETQLSVASSASSGRSVQTRSSASSQTKTYKDILAKISPQLAKKAGTFLDGCCIFLCGFDADEKEKLNKILNAGGATRFDDLNEQLTHIIVGEATPNEVTVLTQNESGATVLNIEWLLASVKQKQPAAEEDFFYRAKLPVLKEPEAPSPSSKRNIQSMSFKKPALPSKKRLQFGSDKVSTPSPRASTSKTSSTVTISSPPHPSPLPPPPAEVEENELLSQYVQQNMSSKSVPTTTSPKPNEQNSAQQQKTPINQENLPPGTAETDVSSCIDTGMTSEDFEPSTFFDGLTLYIHDHDAEFFAQIKEDCEAAGGKVVERNYKNKVDYVIVPSEESTDISSIPVKYKNIVNNLYLDDIIKQNELIDIEYYHEPITVDPELKPLEGVTVVISVYAATERLYIEAIAKVLGAEKMDVYARKQRPLLVCPLAEGAKYNAAIKWNYPVVKSDWLVECSKTGRKISMDPYLVGDTNVPENSSWNSTRSPIENQITQKFVRPATPPKPDINLSTPVSKTARANSSNDENRENQVYLSETIDKGQNLAEMDSPDFRKWVHDYAEECGTSVDNWKKRTISKADSSTGIIDESPALRHRRLSEITDSHKRTSTGSTPPITPPPPAGLNISDFVKDFNTPVRSCIYDTLKEMWNKETPESQKLRQLTNTPGAKTKSPPTPRMPAFCTTPEVEKRRLAFLDTYYLPINKKPRRPSTPLSEIKRRFWKEALGDQYWEINNTNSQLCTQTQDNVFPSSSKQSAGNADAIPDSQINPSAPHVQELREFIKNREVETKSYGHEDDNDAAPHKYDSELIPPTDEMIGWRDPSEFMPARARSMNNMQFEGTPRFSISCTNDNVKQTIIEQIKSLNGELCENLTSFDETCTHIVCERPNRGEKILSCISAGKWILGLQYIEDSATAGNFLEEEKYEWGNPKASNLPNLEGSEQSIANAAFRWRVKIANATDKKSGVFSGFRVILHVSRKEPFQKLLKAGGGYVLNVDPPYCKSDEALQATHCLVETRKVQLTSSDHKALAESGVQVLSVMYLNAYLTSETQPDYSKYLLSL